jgi:hypothetical protein
MTYIQGYFDELHFTESNISGFEFLESDLVITIDSGLVIYGEHPLTDSHKMSDPCRLVFKNIVSSKRYLDIYAGDPKVDGFKESKTIIDNISPVSVGLPCKEYSLEGLLLDPKAWLTWDILAEDFYLDDLKD